jgi:hypothetical protein
VHVNVAVRMVRIEEDAIVAHTQAEFGWLALQWPYVALERLGRQRFQCSLDPTTISQWKPSQIFLRGLREDQLPSHA